VVEECVGVGLLGASIFATLALASLALAEPAGGGTEVLNRAGVIGAAVASLLFDSLGYGAFVALAAMGVLGGRLILGRGVPRPLSGFWVAVPLLLVAVATLPPILHTVLPDRFAAAEGGYLGNALAGEEIRLLGSWGSLLLNGAVVLIGCLGATGISTRTALVGAGLAIGWLVAGLWALVLGLGRALFATARGLRTGTLDLVRGVQRGVRSVVVWRVRRERRARVAGMRGPEIEAQELPELGAADPGAERSVLRARRGGAPTIVDHAAERAERGAEQQAFRFQEAGPSGPYEFPDISVFQLPPPSNRSYDRDSLIMNSRILEKKLQDFGIRGRVVTVHPGPVITMYELEPASGVKLNRIVNLADDLALALRALSVRIIAPLPGKSVVGIEVANAEREVVYIRDLIESETFRSESSKLVFALGKDIFGNPTHADLGKMPHLLVAGATGTGKSVFLNSLLCSILSRVRPDELKLLLVDPKLLELSAYGGIPHLIADVVTNPKRAAAALAGIVHKMEERYQLMAAVGVRSIEQFNARAREENAAGNHTFRLPPGPGEEEGEEIEFAPLPFIVVVIDELADLMVVSARDVEESLQRLAQMARAAGIHLVLATQRPSVDVLTGIIKANFPARISFQVSSRTDSRTILDQNGADHLLGQGDMLFLPPGTSKLQRIHGAFVSEEEVTQLTEALRRQGGPVFDETISRLRAESEAEEARGDDVDEMYDRALDIVADTRNASISYLQRRLKVGYNRAARMIEQMETDGAVGPQEGTKPREVYVRAIEP
jgi:S-DNA-T family DNA segregation ATPase FtsK/SpoIIIE